MIEYAAAIWANDRFFDYKSFARTADYCANVMRDIGLTQVEKLPVIADGKTAYGDWVMPRAWDVNGAFLRMENDDTLLADYAAEPCSLVMYSAPADVIAECVMADDLTPGKILFTDLPPADVLDFAVQHGAAGIVSDHMRLFPGIRDNREQVYDTCMWVNNFAVPVNDTGLFAFSLTPRNGDMLRKRLTTGEKIFLHAKVDTRFYDGEAYTISGLIPGATDEEICFYAHLYEPGAHDNASGCAVLLELARNFATMPKPKYGLRFIMGPECSGSHAYFVKHSERRHRGCIVLDMVGTQDIDNTWLSIWQNPLANLSYIDALGIAAIKEYERTHGAFKWESKPFSIGTDNILGDPCFNMPTIAFLAEPALSYHSSLDTPDRLEAEVLKRNCAIVGWIATQLAYDLKPTNTALKVYRRNVKGCLTFDNRPLLKKEWQPAWSHLLNIPLFWMDGKRTLWEVTVLSANELGEKDVMSHFNMLCEYTEFLAKEGYISCNES